MVYSTIKYEDYKSLIHHCVNKFIDLHNGNYDDLLSEANLAYVHAVNTFDATKGAKFATWLFRLVWQGFINFSKKEVKHRHAKLPKSIYKKGFEWDKAVEALSTQGREMVNIAIDTRYKKYMKRTLRERGWSNKKINKGFAEIKDSLII